MENNFIFENNIIKKTISFYKAIFKTLNNLKNVSSTLSKQIISLKVLIKEVKSENQYSLKLQQLSDRIGMLEDSRKLLKENIKLIDQNISNFENNLPKSSFISNKDDTNLKISNSNNIDSPKKNYNFVYNNTINNNDNNIRSLWQKKHLILNSNINPVNSGYYTINYSTPINKNMNNQSNLNSKNSGLNSIILNPKSSNDSNLNIKSGNYPLFTSNCFFEDLDNGLSYLSHKKNIKIKTGIEIDFDSIAKRNKVKNKINNNSINPQIKSYSSKYSNSRNSYNNNNSNSKKFSRNFSKNRLIKKSRSLSNFISENNLHFNKNNYKINNLILNNSRNYNSNTNSFKHKNIINNTIINNKNEIKSNMINNINYNNTINNNKFQEINEYSFFLSKKVLDFLSLINEMKSKYNNRNSSNKIEFKEIKLKYEKIKKLIYDLSNKIFNNYYKYKTNIEIFTNNLDKKDNLSVLLRENKIYQNKVFNLQNSLTLMKNKLDLREKENNQLIIQKKTLLNDISKKNIIISRLSKELEELKNGNIIKNIKDNNLYYLKLNSNLIDDEKRNKEDYIKTINELKFKIESKNQEIKIKDKSIENLKNKIKNNLNRTNLSDKNKKLVIENNIIISFIKNIEKSIIDKKDEIIHILKNENESLKQKINEITSKINNDINNINHINNNNYIIKELKEKIQILNEDNENYKNENNSLLNKNKSLNQKIDTLTNDINKNELLKKEKENDIKKLELIIEDLNSKINKNVINTKKASDAKEKEDQIELLMTENQELKNQIEELKENENNSILKENENKIIDEYETKIKFLASQNNFYQNELNNMKTENGIIQNEFKNLKEENNVLKIKIKDYKIKNENEDYLLENYEIIGDKNVGKLSWILLKKKDGNKNDSNDYEDYIWVERDIFVNIDNIED